MTFFSDQLVDDQFLIALQRDLERCDICRFVVAYISDSGINRIGTELLFEALRHDMSFGIGSISCACGFKPLMQLQRRLPGETARLKYFMDPALRKSDEPDDIALLHSKLVYLRLTIDQKQKSVVYVGSHNWSSRALGSSGPRNAEASYRFEFPFEENHLRGMGDDMPAKVNRHLIRAFTNPCCLDALEANRQSFEEWTQSVCKNRSPSPLDEVLLILAVRMPTRDASISLSRLTGHGIYLQCLEEDEGAAVWEAPEQALVLVWESANELGRGEQPTILLCNKGTRNAGQTSKRRSSNTADNPIRGFHAVLFDNQQLGRAEVGEALTRSHVRSRKNSDVQVFDLEFPSVHTDCINYDRAVHVKYQYMLEVSAVIEPPSRVNAESLYVWDRSTFAVAHDKRDARVEEVDGYVVPDGAYQEIASALRSDFGVQINETPAKGLPMPASEVNRAKLGKRFARSQIHETFIPDEMEKSPQSLYTAADYDLLTADLDPVTSSSPITQLSLPGFDSVLIERSQRVYTTKIDKLKTVWQQAADSIRNHAR